MDDHYVSQTYLGSFTNESGLLIPYYKSSPATLGKPKLPKSVCYEVDGDSNRYFKDPRILDTYLPQFENPWRHNVERLREHILDDITKYQVAGYLAFLRTCTPTAKRLGQELIKSVLRPTVLKTALRTLKNHPPERADTKDRIEKVPEQKGIDVEIDRQLPHSIGISSLLETTSRFFNGEWHILINNTNVPFLTSDNPAVVYYHANDLQLTTIYIAIAPDIAVLIRADIENKSVGFPLREGSFSLKDQFAAPKTKYIDVFNELIIKDAEKRVFANAARPWIEEKVREFSEWRMETVASEYPDSRGTLIVTKQEAKRIEEA